MNLPKFAVNKVSPISIGQVLERDRLFFLLRQDSPTNAYWISGPGGSGKTTFLASFLKREKKSCLWYQIDALDGDPASFFYYFGQAATSLLISPDMPMPMLTPEYLPRVDVFILRYFETLYQRIEPGSWLIFDNFQDAPDESALGKILAVAVKQLPPHLNLAVISRRDPPPVMARFMANRVMKCIGWNQLAFTSEEFAAYLDFFKTRIAAEDVDRLFQLTQGWIAGIILWLLRHDSGSVPCAVSADQAPENLFDYFAAEILEKSEAEIRHFLLQTAFLPHMTAGMAGEMTGMAAEDILETLYRNNYFLEKRLLSAVSYQYHPLFRKFLLLQASRTFGPDALRTARCRAAEILERQALFEEAVSLYFQAEAYHRIEALILSRAPAFIDQGRHAVLSAWIDSMPGNAVNPHPYLLFWKSVALLANHPQESSMFCTRSYELFVQNNDLVGQVLSWSTAVNILVMLRHNFTGLDWWISEGDRLGKLLPEEIDADLAGRFAAGMLMALLLRGQSHADLARWQLRCESLLDRCSDPQVMIDLVKNLSWAYAWTGPQKSDHGDQIEAAAYERETASAGAYPN